MLKFLIITSLVLYLVYKVGALFFKAGAASQQIRDQQKRSFQGNRNENNPKTKAKPGDYIDYEEVK